jgi:hypothetical protein
VTLSSVLPKIILTRKRRFHCKNVFFIYMTKGSVVELGTKITRKIKTIDPFQSIVRYNIFQSTIECPQYTDVEDCFSVAKNHINTKTTILF